MAESKRRSRARTAGGKSAGDGAKKAAAASASAATTDTKTETAREAAGVASPKANAKLEHSVEGATTRQDLTDVGVPMEAGSPSEPQGPEDALGVGPKRGDYSQRVDQLATESRPINQDGDRAIRDDDGNIVDYAPLSEVVPQAPRTADVGDAEGKKGGVQTDPLYPANV